MFARRKEIRTSLDCLPDIIPLFFSLFHWYLDNMVTVWNSALRSWLSALWVMPHIIQWVVVFVSAPAFLPSQSLQSCAGFSSRLIGMNVQHDRWFLAWASGNSCRSEIWGSESCSQAILLWLMLIAYFPRQPASPLHSKLLPVQCCVFTYPCARGYQRCT